MFSRSRARAIAGFTLVELLVVIAIIGVMVGLLLPAVQAAREAARRMSCQNQMKQIGLALHNHHDVFGRFPPGAENAVFPRPLSGATTIAGTSWIVHTLPFFEQQSLYERYDFSVPHNNANNAFVGNSVVPTIYCPSGPAPSRYPDPNGGGVNGNPSTHYVGVMGPAGTTDNWPVVFNGQTYRFRVGDANNNGAWSFHGILSHFRNTAGSISTNRFVRFRDVIDGTSNTLMVGERSVFLPGNSNDYRSWIRGNNGGTSACKTVMNPINSTNYNGSNNFNHISFGSQHPGGCQFVLGDASVQFVSETIDMSLYQMLSSINEGAVASISN